MRIFWWLAFAPFLLAHEEEEPVGAQVGPDKGITAADEHDGFRLSAEAEKNFGLARAPAREGGRARVPVRAIVTTGTEVNLFRYRRGFYKRIDFSEIERAKGLITVRSDELKAGDEVVTEGLGFLRLTEVSAFGGNAEGHHH